MGTGISRVAALNDLDPPTRAGRFDPPTQPVGIVDLVGEDDAILLEVAQELACDGTISGLARRQHHLERQTLAVSQHVDLGRQSAARAAHRQSGWIFFEFAAC